MGLRPQHRRLPPRRSGAGGGVGVYLLARRAHLPGALGCLHHAGEPGAGESLLGWRRAPARRQSVVHGFLGRLGVRRTLRWLDGAKRRVALDFLRGRGGVRRRNADGARDPREHGRNQTWLQVRHHRHSDVHDRDARPAGLCHARGEAWVDERRVTWPVGGCCGVWRRLLPH